jgi:hypothetical protein
MRYLIVRHVTEAGHFGRANLVRHQRYVVRYLPEHPLVGKTAEVYNLRLAHTINLAVRIRYG